MDATAEKERSDGSMGGLRGLPAGTTTSFGLLIAAVLATALIGWTQIFLATPSNAHRFSTVFADCEAKEPVLLLPARNENDQFWKAEAYSRFSRCVAPVYRDEVIWAVGGALLVFVVATLLYWAQPWYISRRHRLIKVDPQREKELVEALSALWGAPRWRRSPVYWRDPRASRDGRAFGGRNIHFGKRLLTEGMVPEKDTAERKVFDAVLAHEIAHVRERDVAKTYLSIWIWYVFVVVVVAPTLVLAFHPNVLATPFTWSAGYLAPSQWLGTVVALAVLTALVYLTRRAVLRTRELHADARAAATPGVETDTLIRLVGEGGSSGSLHPAATDRRQAIRGSGHVLLRTRRWELFGIGLASAVILGNLRFLLNSAIPTQPLLTAAIPALLCGSGMAGYLGIAQWREALRNRSEGLNRTASGWSWNAVALTVGFVVGERVSLLSASTLDWPTLVTFDRGRAAFAAVLLAAVLLVLARWLASTTRFVLASEGADRPWTRAALILAAMIVFAPWFVGVTIFGKSGSWVPVALGEISAPLTSAGWYAELTRWASMSIDPLQDLFRIPLTVPGFVALWLVPLAASRVRGAPAPPGLRFAVTAGVIGSVATLLADLIFISVLRLSVPLPIRQGSLELTSSVTDVAVLVAVLAEAVVAAIVAMAVGRNRALLIPLAVCSTGILATAITELVIVPTSTCMDVYASADRFGLACLKPPDSVPHLALTAHWILVKGMVAAVPAALLGAAIRARSARSKTIRWGLFKTVRPRPYGKPTAAVLALLIVAAAAVGVFGIPNAEGYWIATQPTAATASNSNAPTGSATVEPCVIGTWTETFRAFYQRIDGAEVRLTGANAKQTFRGNGLGILEFRPGTAQVGTLHGQPVELALSGKIDFTYETHNGEIVYHNLSPTGSAILKIGGVVRPDIPLTGQLEKSAYSCHRRTMSFTGINVLSDLTRTSSTPPPSPPATDPCLIGTWTETLRISYIRLNGTPVRWTAHGVLHRFYPDGTVTLDFGAGAIEYADIPGRDIQVLNTGTITYTYEVSDQTIRYRNPIATGTSTLRINRIPSRTFPLTATTDPDFYDCHPTTLRIIGPTYAINLTRTE